MEINMTLHRTKSILCGLLLLAIALVQWYLRLLHKIKPNEAGGETKDLEM